MVVHLPSEKSILPYFSSPRGVAILDCDSQSQAGSTNSRTTFKFGGFWDWNVRMILHRVLGGKEDSQISDEFY